MCDSSPGCIERDSPIGGSSCPGSWPEPRGLCHISCATCNGPGPDACTSYPPNPTTSVNELPTPLFDACADGQKPTIGESRVYSGWNNIPDTATFVWDLDWSPIKASKASTRMDAYHVADKARECGLVARAVQRLIEGDLASSDFVSEISCKYGNQFQVAKGGEECKNAAAALNRLDGVSGFYCYANVMLISPDCKESVSKLEVLLRQNEPTSTNPITDVSVVACDDTDRPEYHEGGQEHSCCPVGMPCACHSDCNGNWGEGDAIPHDAYCVGDAPGVSRRACPITTRKIPAVVSAWVKEALQVDGDIESTLIYDALRDGWSAANFHAACDNKGATVTLAKTSNSPDFFGGFADVAWSSSNNYAPSSRSFLFTLGEHTRNRVAFNNLRINIPTVDSAGYTVSDMQTHALYHGDNVGPCFGSPHEFWKDLCFADSANANYKSQDNPTSSYDVDVMFDDVGSGGMLTGASSNFRPTELFVFNVKAVATTHTTATTMSTTHTTATATTTPTSTPINTNGTNSSATSNGGGKARKPAGTAVPIVLVLMCLAGTCAIVLHHRKKRQSAAAAAAARELGGAQIVEMMRNPLRYNANRNAVAAPTDNGNNIGADGNGDGGSNDDGGGYLHVAGAFDGDTTSGGAGGSRGSGGGRSSDPRHGSSPPTRVVRTSISNPHLMFSIPMEIGGSGAGGETRMDVVEAAYAEIENYAAPPSNATATGAGEDYEEINHNDAAECQYSAITGNAELYRGSDGSSGRGDGAGRSWCPPADYAAADGSGQMYEPGPAQYSAADGSEIMYEIATTPQSEAQNQDTDA